MKNDGIGWQHKAECLQILSKSYGYIFDTPFLTKELLFDAHSKTAADLYVCMGRSGARKQQSKHFFAIWRASASK